MHVLEEVLQLRHECGRSQREIARACGLSAGAVNQVLQRAARAGVVLKTTGHGGLRRLERRCRKLTYTP